MGVHVEGTHKTTESGSLLAGPGDGRTGSPHTGLVVSGSTGLLV